MNARPFAPVLALALAAVPAPLPAQMSTVASYVSADHAVAGGPVLVGANVGWEAGYAGVRAGVGVAARTLFGSDAEVPLGEASGVVNGDLDAQLFLRHPQGDAPVIPYLSAGVGLRAARDDYGSSVAPLWTAGAGVRTPLAGWLAMEGEVRRRQLLVAGEPSLAAAEGWEFRFGASVRVRGRSGARRPAVVPAGLPARASLPAATAGGSAAGALALRTIQFGGGFLGTRYTWGGNTPDQGFDCSGFVRYVYARHGIQLPRVSRDQARAGRAVPLDLAAFQPGDLLAFASDGGVVDHIAIYAGEGRILHSSQSGKGVRYDDLLSRRGKWYLDHLVAARRVIE